MVNMTSASLQVLKKVMANLYSRDQVFLQFLVEDFRLSEEGSIGEEADGTYACLGSQVVGPDAEAALKLALYFFLAVMWIQIMRQL